MTASPAALWVNSKLTRKSLLRFSSVLLLITVTFHSTLAVTASQKAPSFSAQNISLATPPYFVAVGDLNGDGKQDIVASEFDESATTGTVGIYLGNGQGGFSNVADYPVTGTPVSLQILDVNHDTNMDIVTAGDVSNSISVLIGNGNGTFAQEQVVPAGDDAHFVGMGNFNNDIFPDLAVVNAGPGMISILLNNGDGTFADGSPIVLSETSNPHALTAADVNGDLKTDIVVCLLQDNEVGVIPGNGDGTFGPSSTFAVGSEPHNLTVADLNNDGKKDIVTSNSGDGTVSVLLGNGNGTFAGASTFTVGSIPLNVVAEDFNGDGIPDLATADNGSSAISVLRGNGDGTFAAALPITVGTDPTTLASGDFNGDGKKDLVVANRTSSSLTILINTTPSTPNTGDILISQFRFHGATGPQDQFIEFYNTSDSPITVSTTDGSSGWALVGSDGVVRFVIRVNKVIPAHGHLLAVNVTGYSLGNYGGPGAASGDSTFDVNIPEGGGVALFRSSNPANFTLSERLDAVGFSGVDPLYSVGSALLPAGGIIADGEHAFVRNLATGMPQNTSNNASDFVFVATDGATYSGRTAVLGSPGPENLTSPLINVSIPSTLIEPLSSKDAAPNRVRSGSGNSGTISIRRRFTNNTGNTVSALRFRVVDITTLNSAGYANPAQADLRITDSSDFAITTSRGLLTIKGTLIESPPVPLVVAGRGNNAGLNSTVTVTLPGGGLAPGSSIDTQFLLNVFRSGSFRFFVNIEAVP
jgi:hypothetical protein